MKWRALGAVALVGSAAVQLTLGFGASTVGAFIIAATVGLVGVHEKWQGSSVFAAAVSEVQCVVVGAALLLESRAQLRARRPAVVGRTV